MDVVIVTSPYWFVKARFEALIFALPGRHLVFLEPEVTIFGREGEVVEGRRVCGFIFQPRR